MDDVKMDDVSVVREFIARINAADVEGLGRLMAPDHSLEVFDEAPFVGRDENIEAWHGYAGVVAELPHLRGRDRPTRRVGRRARSHDRLSPRASRRGGGEAHPHLGCRRGRRARAHLAPRARTRSSAALGTASRRRRAAPFAHSTHLRRGVMSRGIPHGCRGSSLMVWDGGRRGGRRGSGLSTVGVDGELAHEVAVDEYVDPGDAGAMIAVAVFPV